EQPDPDRDGTDEDEGRQREGEADRYGRGQLEQLRVGEDAGGTGQPGHGDREPLAAPGRAGTPGYPRQGAHPQVLLVEGEELPAEEAPQRPDEPVRGYERGDGRGTGDERGRGEQVPPRVGQGVRADLRYRVEPAGGRDVYRRPDEQQPLQRPYRL